MPGHAPGNGVDAVAHLDAPAFQRIGKQLDLVLGLGQGHAITGHDNHISGVLHKLCGFGFPAVRTGGGSGLVRRAVALGIGQQPVKGLAGVAGHEDHAVTSVQGVGHARVAGFVVIVGDDDVFGFVGLEDGHAVDGRAFGSVGCRVHNVVGAHHDHKVGLCEHGVHRVHFEQVLIVHVGFGKQHVHMPGHAPGNGVDAVAHPGAPAFQQVGKLFDLVLGLGQGHAVTGHDNHISGVLYKLCGFAFDGPGRGSSPGGRSSLFGRGRRGHHRRFAKQDGQQFPVHGTAHDARQQIAGRADNTADGHKQGVIDCKTGNGRTHAAH